MSAFLKGCLALLFLATLSDAGTDGESTFVADDEIGMLQTKDEKAIGAVVRHDAVGEGDHLDADIKKAVGDEHLGSSISIKLNKRTTTEHRHRRNRAQPRNPAGKKQLALVDMEVVHKTAYFGEVALGSTGQKFQVVFDTGSANLIVPASDCTAKACTIHDQYSKAESSNAVQVNCDGSPMVPGMEDQVKITFGTGSIEGRCIQDDICLGNVCSTGQFISAFKESASPFAEFKFDGVLGLSLPVMAQGREFSMMQRMQEGGQLKEALFSVFLSDSDSEVSEITFGQINEEHKASDIFWVPVHGETGYWQVSIADVTFDDQEQNICEDCKVAVDTGTSQLAGPPAVTKELTNKLNVMADCSNFDSLPKLGFVVGSHILNLHPKDYIDKDSDGCYLSMMDIDVPPPKGPLFIFGIPFLQKFYTIYDLPNRRVGFAQAKHDVVEVGVFVDISMRQQALFRQKAEALAQKEAAFAQQ